MKGYWSRPNPWNSSLPAAIKSVILFYNERGDEINYTVISLNQSLKTGCMALNLSKGETIMIKILLTAESYKNYNSTVYLYIDVFADLSDPSNYNNYAKFNISLYQAVRG